MLIKILYVLLILLSSSSYAVIHDTQVFPFFFVQGKVTPKLTAQVLLQPRVVDHFRYMAGFITNFNLMYKAGDHLSLGGGYFYIPWRYPNRFGENRPFLQGIYQASHHRWNFLLRTRQEFRFIEDRAETGLRIRQMVRAAYTMNQAAKVSLIAWDEIFYNFNSLMANDNSSPITPHEGLDQNRLFLGVGHKFGESHEQSFEIGYLKQYVFRFQKEDLSNDAILTQYIFNIN